MMLNRDDDSGMPSSIRLDPDLNREDTGRSNFASFLIGGLVVAGGLFAFLFYDGGALDYGRDLTATGSTPTIQTPASPAVPTGTPAR